jgi:hypothetical protein
MTMPSTAARVALRDASSLQEAETALTEIKARDLPAEPLIFQVWCALANAAQKSAELAHSLADTRKCIDELRGELRKMQQQAPAEWPN